MSLRHKQIVRVHWHGEVVSFICFGFSHASGHTVHAHHSWRSQTNIRNANLCAKHTDKSAILAYSSSSFLLSFPSLFLFLLILLSLAHSLPLFLSISSFLFFFLPFYHLKGTIVTSSTSSLDILAASLPLFIMVWKIQRQPTYIYFIPWYMSVKRFPYLLAFAAWDSLTERNGLFAWSGLQGEIVSTF